MSTIQISLIISGLVASWLAACYLDNKYKLHFVAWFSGECNNPFQEAIKEHNPTASRESESVAKDREIAELKERIQVLEKVVTEPAYELNRKINGLK